MKEKQKQVLDTTLKGIDIPVVDGRVSARELHCELKVDTRFNDWIARRIEEYGFEEGIDFYSEWSKTDVLKNEYLEPQGIDGLDAKKLSQMGYRKEYSITLGMAKELAMLEKNEVGRRVRKYFIKCEENLIEAVKQGMVPEEMLLEAKAELKYLEQANDFLTKSYNDIRLMYQNCTNEVAEYVNVNLVYKKSGKVKCNDLYNHYCRWCRDTPHYEPYERKQFEELLLERMVDGHSIVKDGNYYKNIEVRK